LTGVLKNALDKCVRDGIAVTALALGSDEGRPVPVETASQESSAEVPILISRRDAAVMRIAAERTGGIYIDGSRDDASEILSGHLLSLVRETGAIGGRPEPKERRTLFIILAIIAYGASKFIPLLPCPRPQHVSVLIMVFILSPFLQNCSQGKLFLLEANYLNSHGRYDEAITPYLEALNYQEAAPYAQYGLGLTFYSLDEGQAALKQFDDSQKSLESFSASEHRELRYRNNYNSGIVFFTEGDFRSAADAFKEALREDPRKIEAKRNLELSLMSLARETAGGNNNETPQEDKTMDILFGYLKEKEQQQWKSREWTPEEEPAGPDY
jgi:Ca-activated chloride channel family protein